MLLPRAHRRSPRRHDGRGLSESVQWAVLTPVVLFVLLGGIHAGIVLHGRTVAANAALAGAEAQALAGASEGVGARVAREVAEQGGLRSVEVSTASPPGAVSVRVDGRVSSFLPGALDAVHGSGEQPVEVPR